MPTTTSSNPTRPTIFFPYRADELAAARVRSGEGTRVLLSPRAWLFWASLTLAACSSASHSDTPSVADAAAETRDSAPTMEARDAAVEDAQARAHAEDAGEVQQASIKASNPSQGSFFGSAAALSADGNTLAVAAVGESSDAVGINGNESDTSTRSAGAVFVFTRSGTTWSQQAYVKASNTRVGQWFGSAIALSADGNTLAVGADGDASDATGIDGDPGGAAAVDSGAVFVFTRSGSTWMQRAYLKPSNTSEGEAFGGSVALSADGDTLAVGAVGEPSDATGVNGDQSDESLTQAGAVYVFACGSSTWSQQAYVKASNTATGAAFGYAVALSSDGTTLAVGADGEKSNATGIGGNQSDTSVTGAGAVYVFTRSAATTWTQQAYVKASNTAVNGEFGASLALSSSGDALAVGAWGESSDATGIDGNQSSVADDGAGAVFLFARSASTWMQQAYVKASNTATGDNFGFAVALSSDGTTLVVGANGESSGTTGVNGDQTSTSDPVSGAVYVFAETGTTWAQREYVKASDTAAGANFGSTLALSSDGTTLAVGAESAKNGADDHAGAIYIFR